MSSTDDAELVSVIVPVFNGERFLRATLESIAAQDYQPIEVLLVDDGSTDGTGDIVRSFPQVRYSFQENAGVSAARNAGISAAQGDFLAFFDGDDIMLPHKISAQVGFLREHPDIGCVLARHEVLVEDGFAPPRELVRDSVYGDLDGVQWESAMVRRSVVGEVGGFDTSYRMAEGLEWLGRMRSAGVGIGVLDRVVNYRRIHDDNASHDRPEMHTAVARLLKERAARARAGREQGDSA